jgi:predicted metal-dependent enzyme (double-stranded beta helix superfamily)
VTKPEQFQMKTKYSIQNFISDVIKIMSETEDESVILERVSPLAMRAAVETDWRNDSMYRVDSNDGFGTTLLHAESDDSLFIVVDCWLPGRGVRPHEHGTWAVVVGVTGVERNTFWDRTDDGSKEGFARLSKLKDHRISGGEVICMKTGEIHSVQNETDEITLTFHVYGRHLNSTGRSQFDVENDREIPFSIKIAPVQNTLNAQE